MEGSHPDFDRLLFFEHARKTAELAYAKNLSMPSFLQDRPESIKYITNAESKLGKALEINPNNHEALWCLCNAYTSHAFYTQDNETVKGYFAKATQYFQDAVNEAPELHLEFHKQVTSQPAAVEGPSVSNPKVSKKKSNPDLRYDILGWVILAVGIIVWVGMAKSQASPLPIQ